MTTSLVQPGCQGDTKDSCDDIPSWECYDPSVRHDCCNTCEDNVIQPVVPGCEYGDRVEVCHVYSGTPCYLYSDIRRDCCNTCQNYETSIPGCRFGDKIDGCKQQDCQQYSPQQRAECCMTCTNDATTGAHVTNSTWSTWSTQLSSITTSPSTTGSTVTTVKAEGSKLPDWTVPVAASVGGALVLIVVILVVLLLRRRHRKSDHESPITDKMYNDYKMSKRAPMAPPRHPSTEKGWINENEESEYAYINPRDVEGPRSNDSNPGTKDRRQGNDPLPSAPGEYLDLCDAKPASYGYSPIEGLSRDTISNERVPSNKYDQFPSSKTYVNQTESAETSHRF